MARLRFQFDDDEINLLADSIREKGLLQPILVRRRPSQIGAYEVIAGERRRLAAEIAGLRVVPVVIHDVADRAALELALTENLQRRDLTPIEEAEGYRRLIDDFGHSQEQLAQMMGKSRSHVANTLRLLKLAPDIKHMVENGQLTAGHARALLTVENTQELAQSVVSEGLSVRETETLAQKAKPDGLSEPRINRPTSQEITALRREIAEHLGLEVSISVRGQSGSLHIRFTEIAQLHGILQALRAGSKPANGANQELSDLVDQPAPADLVRQAVA